jgi:hypothetical protein
LFTCNREAAWLTNGCQMPARVRLGSQWKVPLTAERSAPPSAHVSDPARRRAASDFSALLASPVRVLQLPSHGTSRCARSTSRERAGSSETFDDEPRAVTIVMNCPPELLRRLVTSLSERAHNTLDCCDRLFACWIGGQPCARSITLSSASRVSATIWKATATTYSNSRTFGLFFFPKGSPMRCPLLALFGHPTCIDECPLSGESGHDVNGPLCLLMTAIGGKADMT